MTCQEFHALVAAHALGALDAEERTAAEEHLALAEHDGSREALLTATETVQELHVSRVSELAYRSILLTLNGCERFTRAHVTVRCSAMAGEQDEAFAVAQLPGSRLIALAPQGDAAQRATILVNTDAHRAVIMAQGLLAQVDKDYELWVIRGDQKLAAGLLRANARGELALVVDSRLLEGGVDAFAVTLEPAGGGEAPRGPILLVGKV